MGRAGGGNTADPERLARVLDVKKRSLGVRPRAHGCCWQCVPPSTPPLKAVRPRAQVDVGALDAQVAAKVATRDEAAAEARCAVMGTGHHSLTHECMGWAPDTMSGV
jgi:hypothetical protein